MQAARAGLTDGVWKLLKPVNARGFTLNQHSCGSKVNRYNSSPASYRFPADLSQRITEVPGKAIDCSISRRVRSVDK